MKGRQPAAGCDIDGGTYRTDLADAELLDRFVSCRDEAAFAALVARHGPMVLGVCRRLLRHAQDAEDAFQATFLVFVRKAATIGRRELLGNWLYGVAARVAARARLVAARHRTRETADTERITEVARQPAKPPEISEAIETEIQRLPARYRVPVVLYYLEGRTSEEVAGELRCPVGTVKTRLSRAREMLRKRLTRRGLALSTAAFSNALLAEAPAALPPALIDSTLKAAAGGFVSAQAAALTKGVLQTMLVTKMKTLGIVVLALIAVVGGAGAFAYHRLATEPPAKKAKSKPDKEAIQGNWEVVSLESDKGASKKETELLKNAIWAFEKEKILWKAEAADEVIEATYKLDPTKTPKTIDLTIPFGDRKRHIEGIYKLGGDDLTLCIPLGQDKPRPKEFKAEEGSKCSLIVLKRKK